MIDRNGYIRKRLLDLTRELKFQTFEIFFTNPVNNMIEREFFILRPAKSCEGHINWNSVYKVLEYDTKVVGKNRIINTYPVNDYSLTKEALISIEMIVVNDFNEVDVAEYSYSHKAAYEDEYRAFLITHEGVPRLRSNIIIPVIDRRFQGIFTVMNKYREEDGERVFDEINNNDISTVMKFAAELSMDLTYKFGFRRTIIPSIELNKKEKTLYNSIVSDEEVIGKSVAFQNILKRIAKASFSNAPVLLLGDTGVGKTYFARLLYKSWQCSIDSRHKVEWDTGRQDVKVKKALLGGKEKNNKQFRNINIAAIPDTLFESELFGSVKGAATDIKGRFGILIEENGNPLVVLLDEIGDLSSANQAKLLKCIEEHEISLVGSTVQIPLDNMRIIAATNRQDILHGADDNTLRSDLAYRFKDIIYIPPLSQRTEDIEPLIKHILKKSGKTVIFDRTTLEILKTYHFPGNIRELESIITYCLSRLKADEKRIRYFHLPRTVLASQEYEGLLFDEKAININNRKPSRSADGKKLLDDIKDDYDLKRKELVDFYYKASNGNTAETARLTGISEAHIRRILRS